MSKNEKEITPSCAYCGTLNCYRKQKSFPSFCLTESSKKQNAKALKLYTDGGTDAKIAIAAAEIEGEYYGRLTRVEETVLFAKKIGAKKIGIATCIGLIEETRVFAKVLENAGLTPKAVLCKVGAIDKTEAGIAEEMKVEPGQHESLCNPALQAKLLEEWGSELNVVVGLCVGHDSIFLRHSKVPTTCLIVKDRVLAHNPAGALHTAGFYYKRILDPAKYPEPHKRKKSKS